MKRGFDINDLPIKYQQQAYEQLATYGKKDSNRTADTAADVEPDNKNAISKPIQNGQHNKRVCISIHSIRKRLADPDGISAKAAIDGIVKAGLIEDDSAKYVEEVRFSQEKGKEEKTIITLEWE